MAYRSYRSGRRIGPALLLGTVSYLVFQHTGPIIHGQEIAEIPTFAAAGMALSGAALASEMFGLIGNGFDFLEAKTPKGNKGTSGWVKSLREIKKDLLNCAGPYLGGV